ncbi:leucine-rich repeat-containing protein let-4-like [Sitodiplosis mosellana]|uniref:leucine-rich repeat-containing protein let-4-like n=1 Tax=Sitodiplosis mosellana TaxID=263140 RepID=UPI00244414DE|nr:leucine-rich repeat-containing protein let-4-like [Sitodiplosis mosellana]
MPLLTEIDFSTNQIQVVNFKRLTESNIISSVNLSNNEIWHIDDGSFSNLLKLETLDLSHNRLGYFSDAVLTGNNKLKELHLNKNPLKNQNLTFASSLKMLEILDLSNTRIKEVNDDCFVNNPNMKEVNLEGTPLKRFNFNTFSSEAGLVEVHLPSESIQELDISCGQSICHFKRFDDNDYFKNIRFFIVSGNRKQNISNLLKKMGSDLEKLDLSRTSIATLNVSMLETFPNLRHLDLSNSNISKIEDDAFAKQSQLISVDLSKNLLAEIDSVKMNLASLQILNLVGNKLTKLGMVNSNNLPNLKLLKIAENPFDPTYLYNTLNAWVKNGLWIDVELIQPTTTQKTTTTRKTTKQSNSKPTIPTKTSIIGTTTDSTSASTSLATTESDDSSGKSTNLSSIQPTQVNSTIIIGGVFIIIVIVSIVIWYICRRVSAKVVGTSVTIAVDTGGGTVSANEIRFVEPTYEEIKEPMQPMQTFPSAYAIGNIHETPHYENAPTHTTTLDRYRFNAALPSNEYSTVYHHYTMVSKPKPKRFSQRTAN